MNKNKPNNDEFVRKPCEEENAPKGDNPAEENNFEHIQDSGAVVTERDGSIIHCLTIVGQIEGHYLLPQNTKTTKYEHVIPMLVAIDEDPRIDGLLILLNTVGGDVEAGLAIAELIAGMRKPTASLVLGGGHSIGVPLAVSAKKSLIAPSAAMTIHPVRINGVVIGVPQTYAYLSRIQDRILGFVTAHSHVLREDYLRLMNKTDELANDVGSVIHGEEAVRLGLIDEVGSLSDALDWLHGRIAEG